MASAWKERHSVPMPAETSRSSLSSSLHLVKPDVRGRLDQLQEKGRMNIEFGALRLPLPATFNYP